MDALDRLDQDLKRFKTEKDNNALMKEKVCSEVLERLKNAVDQVEPGKAKPQASKLVTYLTRPYSPITKV